VADKILECLKRAERVKIDRDLKINDKEIDYNPQARTVTLPKSMWVDSYAMRNVFFARLCLLTNTRIIECDPGSSFKDQNTAEDVEKFWKGMYCSLDEKNCRVLRKNRKGDAFEDGIT